MECRVVGPPSIGHYRTPSHGSSLAKITPRTGGMHARTLTASLFENAHLGWTRWLRNPLIRRFARPASPWSVMTIAVPCLAVECNDDGGALSLDRPVSIV